jgi:hypothetical protein
VGVGVGVGVGAADVTIAAYSEAEAVAAAPPPPSPSAADADAAPAADADATTAPRVVALTRGLSRSASMRSVMKAVNLTTHLQSGVPRRRKAGQARPHSPVHTTTSKRSASP